MTINNNIVVVRIETERPMRQYYLAMKNRHQRNVRISLVINVLKIKELHLKQKLLRRVKNYLLKSIRHNLVLLRLIERLKSHQLLQRKDHDNRMLRYLQSELVRSKSLHKLQEHQNGFVRHPSQSTAEDVTLSLIVNLLVHEACEAQIVRVKANLDKKGAKKLQILRNHLRQGKEMSKLS